MPESAGAAVFTGAAGATTTALCSETAWAEPAELVAVTWTRSVWPTSPATSVYVALVAPPTLTQSPPADEQRRHW